MNIAQLPVRAVARALHVFDVVAFDNRLVCVRHGRAPRAALTTSTSSRATAALEAVAWPSAQARSNDRQRCRHQSVHFMRVSSTHFVRAVAASRLWRSLIGLPPWCALRRSRLLPPSRRRPSRRTKLVPSARHVDRSFWPRHLCGRPAAIYDLREMPVANATRERPTMPCF